MFVTALYNLKGGVGKTASCVNLAHLATMDGFRTLVWDMDAQGAAGFYFKMQVKEKSHFKKLLDHERGLDELIQQTEFDGLDIIPADKSSRKLDLILGDQKNAKKQLKQLLKQVRDQYDFVFIDCPPGFSLLADNIFEAADIVLMPTIPTTLSQRTYHIVRSYMEQKQLPEDKLMGFFTMVDVRKNLHQEIMEALLHERCFFEYYIPYLSDVEKMGRYQQPVTAFAPNSRAAQCYAALWEEIKEGVL